MKNLKIETDINDKRKTTNKKSSSVNVSRLESNRNFDKDFYRQIEYIIQGKYQKDKKTNRKPDSGISI